MASGSNTGTGFSTEFQLPNGVPVGVGAKDPSVAVVSGKRKGPPLSENSSNASKRVKQGELKQVGGNRGKKKMWSVADYECLASVFEENTETVRSVYAERPHGAARNSDGSVKRKIFVKFGGAQVDIVSVPHLFEVMIGPSFESKRTDWIKVRSDQPPAERTPAVLQKMTVFAKQIFDFVVKKVPRTGSGALTLEEDTPRSEDCSGVILEDSGNESGDDVLIGNGNVCDSLEIGPEEWYLEEESFFRLILRNSQAKRSRSKEIALARQWIQTVSPMFSVFEIIFARQPSSTNTLSTMNPREFDSVKEASRRSLPGALMASVSSGRSPQSDGDRSSSEKENVSHSRSGCSSKDLRMSQLDMYQSAKAAFDSFTNGWSRPQSMHRLFGEVITSEEFSELGAFKSEVSAVKTDVSGVKSDLSEVKADVSEMQRDLSFLKDGVSSILELLKRH
eukprot:ANDGO_07408.mRNA.1 hypothetical protein